MSEPGGQNRTSDGDALGKREGSEGNAGQPLTDSAAPTGGGGRSDCSQIETPAFRHRLRKGEPPAWTLLVRCLQPLLEYITLAAGARGAQIDEVVGETWFRAFRAHRKLDAARAVTPWLVVICKNVGRDQFRKRRPELLGETQHGKGAWTSPAEAPNAWKGVEKLPDAERQTVVLHFAYGVSPAEIAKLHSVSAAAVYQRLSRGLRRLRDMRKGDGDDA